MTNFVWFAVTAETEDEEESLLRCRHGEGPDCSACAFHAPVPAAYLAVAGEAVRRQDVERAMRQEAEFSRNAAIDLAESLELQDRAQRKLKVLVGAERTSRAEQRSRAENTLRGELKLQEGVQADSSRREVEVRGEVKMQDPARGDRAGPGRGRSGRAWPDRKEAHVEDITYYPMTTVSEMEEFMTRQLQMVARAIDDSIKTMPSESICDSISRIERLTKELRESHVECLRQVCNNTLDIGPLSLDCKDYPDYPDKTGFPRPSNGVICLIQHGFQKNETERARFGGATLRDMLKVMHLSDQVSTQLACDSLQPFVAAELAPRVRRDSIPVVRDGRDMMVVVYRPQELAHVEMLIHRWYKAYTTTGLTCC